MISVFQRKILTIVAVILAAWQAPLSAWPTSSEWVPVFKGGQIIQDSNSDTNGSRNIVSDATHAALFIFNDGTNLHFRIRLDQNPAGTGGQGYLQAFGWGVLFDTNKYAGDYEWMIMLDGISRVESIALRRNDIQGALGDPSDKAETLSQSLPLPGNYLISAADTSFNGDQDYFLDWRFPFATFKTVTGTNDSWPLRIFAGSSSSANNLTENGADLLGSSDLYSGFSDFFTPYGSLATTGAVKFVAGLDGNGDVQMSVIGTSLFIRVDDQDRNALSDTAETLDIFVTASNGDKEPVAVKETGLNTGIFTGTINTVLSSTGVKEDGILQVDSGTGATAEYVDQVDSLNKVDQLRTDSVGFMHAPAPALSLVKTAQPLNPSPGQEIIYTIEYTNSGSGEARDVLINDQVPDNTTYISGSIRLGGQSAAYSDGGLTSLTDAIDADAGASDGTTVQVRLPVVAAGAGGRIFFKVTLN